MKVRNHRLKAWPNDFELAWCGERPFEIRINDRGYQRGDTVTLREWDRHADCSCGTGGGRYEHRDDCAKYTGRTITATIGCVAESTPPRGSQRGFVGNGYVVFSLCDLEKVDGRAAAPSPLDIARKGGAL